MQQEPAATRIQWNTPDAVEQAETALRKGAPVEITLPADFHHALFTHVHPDAGPGDPEHIDENGGGELIRRIAEVRRLQPLARLAEAAEAARARVRVQSPAPRIIILPGEG